MKMSEKGLKLLMDREGCELKAYRDTVGIWTIGIGHTSAAGPPSVKQGMVISQEDAETIFKDDVAEFEEGVTDLLDRKPIGQHQFDAFVSLAYNIGLGAFSTSTTLRRFLAGDHAGAAQAILLWNKPPEIKARRRGEYAQFQNTQHTARA